MVNSMRNIQDVVLSYESLPELFDSFSPDIAFAYAQRINSTAHLAQSMEGLPVEMPNLEE